MLRSMLVVGLATTVVGVPGSSAAAQSMTAGRRMTVVGDVRGSLLTRGPRGGFEGTLQNLGAVVHHEGTFHLYFNDLQNGWPPSATLIGHATSTDGIAWHPSSDEPILTGADVPYATGGITVHSVLVTPEGRWLMYFDTPRLNVIGRATAPGPTGPWTPDTLPILQADGADAWDGRGLTAPSVLRTDAGYVMYFATLGPVGGPDNPQTAIGRATSRDGIHWRKDDHPVFVHGDSASWDGYKVESPRVVRVGHRWLMAYRSDNGDDSWGGNTAYGLATSRDGIQWERWGKASVLSEDDVPVWATLWSVALIVVDGELRLYVETDGPPIRGTRVNLATFPVAALGLHP